MIKQENWQNTLIYNLFNENLTISLAPSLGNNVFRIWDRRTEREVLRVPSSPAALIETPGHFGTPLMMPPNRIRNGKFSYGGTDYQFEINHPTGNHIHGFLRSRPWEITDVNEAGMSISSRFLTRDFPEILTQYPHELRFDMTYTLKGTALIQKTQVTNNGTTPAPFGFGLHTWFMIDAEPDKWKLQIPVVNIWELDDMNIPTGKLLPLGDLSAITEGISLNQLNLDTVFQNSSVNACIARLYKDDYEIRYSASNLFKQWVIYTMGPADQIICLEPYTWVTDAPNVPLSPEITGMRVIQPGETLKMDVSLDIIIM